MGENGLKVAGCIVDRYRHCVDGGYRYVLDAALPGVKAELIVDSAFVLIGVIFRFAGQVYESAGAVAEAWRAVC